MFGKFDEESLCYIATYFNRKMISLSDISKRQDSKFVKKIRIRAFEKLVEPLKIPDKTAFFVGSVDFMVQNENGDKRFIVLETNGGSSRGILSLSSEQIDLIFNAYKLAIDESITNDHKLIVIGSIPNDLLFQEKIILAEFLKSKYEIEGFSVGIFNSFNFEPSFVSNFDIIIIIANYNNLLEHLSFKNDYITFKGQNINILIGDGIARRFPIISAYMKNDLNKIKTLIVNKIYQITDDKANTYLTLNFINETLKKFRILNLKFYKASDPFNLEKIIDMVIQNSKKNFIIKPYASSGGVGIQPVLSKNSKEQVSEIMQKSISEFYEKFDSWRTPFPYTIQEMVNFSLIDYLNSKRTFDIRIYIIQKDGIFYPVGGQGRIAKYPFTGSLKKEEFVVNISGYGGIDTDRVIPFSEEGLKILNLSEEDLADMFAAGCYIFKGIIENYNKVMNFSNWDKL